MLAVPKKLSKTEDQFKVISDLQNNEERASIQPVDREAAS